MTQITRLQNSRRKIFTLTTILVVVFVIQVLCDPLSYFLVLGEKLEVRIGLPRARAQWQAQKITHYQFDLRGYVPLLCMIGANIEVKDEVVVGIRERSDGQLSMLPSSPAGVDIPLLCDYRNFTMSRFFDEFGPSSTWQITGITFDKEYGFISELKFGYAGGNGLLAPRISDCCGGFTIENFQPLAEP